MLSKWSRGMLGKPKYTVGQLLFEENLYLNKIQAKSKIVIGKYGGEQLPLGWL